MKHARLVETWPDDYFHHQMQCGPGVVFPALFIAASVFAVHHGLDPHPGLKPYVNSFNPNQPVLPPNTFYFLPEIQWIKAGIAAGHTIALVACPTRKQVLVSIDIFNCMPVGIVLPYVGSERVQASYGVDVTTGKVVPVVIDTMAAYGLAWAETHKLGDQALRDHFSSRISHLVSLSYQRINEKEIRDALSRALPDDGDREATDDDLVAVAEEISGIILRRLTMPSASYAHAEKSLETFDGLSAQLEAYARDEPKFKNRVRPLRNQFVDIVASARQVTGK